MAIVIRNNKESGEKFVYETVRTLNSETGKFVSEMKLLGRLYPAADNDDISDAGKLFAAEEAPANPDELDVEMQSATDVIANVVSTVMEEEDEEYSPRDALVMMKEVTDAVQRKDNAYGKLKASYKELLTRAAEEVRRNELLADANAKLTARVERLSKKVDEHRDEAMKDLLEYNVMRHNLEVYEQMIENFERMQKLFQELVDKQNEHIETLKSRNAGLIKLLSQFMDVSQLEDNTSE